MEANPLQAELSCQLHDLTEGKHAGAKEKINDFAHVFARLYSKR